MRFSLVPTLVAIAFIALIAGGVYTLNYNAEVAFFRGAYVKKQAWAKRLDERFPSKFVVAGGSSAGFSIDANRALDRFNLPIVNAGLHAGMGLSVTTKSALEFLRSGDTLVLAAESGLLTTPAYPPALGIQFSAASHKPDWVTDGSLGLPGISCASLILALRPGIYQLVTDLGKRVRHDPPYRYALTDVDDAGFFYPRVRRPFEGPPGHAGRLNGEARHFLEALKRWCEARNVRIVYSLPWAYCPAEELYRFQDLNRRLLLDIAEVVPVLQDAHFGAYPIREHFADSVWHLIDDGARARTDVVSTALTGWNVYSESELRRTIPGSVQMSSSVSPVPNL